LEAAAGDAGAAPEARAIVVSDAAGGSDLASFCNSVGSRLAGVVLNRVPTTRRDRILEESRTEGLEVLLDLPEDRLLATPSLGDVAAALNAQTMYFDGNGNRPLDRAVIASISADPGQGYFLHRDANSVIVRSDKPDLQLAALNAGATCLIVTGELPILGYVLERAEADEIPIIRTPMETLDAVKGIEELYGGGPFSGSAEKLSRLAELTQGFDATSLSAA
jgi:BioD-like phosphotransacetylase family protein